MANTFDYLYDREAFKRGLRDALGANIQSPTVVALGYEDETGKRRIYVETEDGEYNKYYFHELAGSQSFIGEVYATGGNAIPTEYAKYGLPIRIRQDPLSYGSTPQWILDGLDPFISSQFILPSTPSGEEGDGASKKNYVQLSQFVPSLLTPTDPASMKCRLRGGFYGLGETIEYWNSTDTGQFGTSDIENYVDGNTITLPPNVNQDYIVAIQRNVKTGVITYVLGEPVPSSLNWIQLWEYDRNQSPRYTVFSRPYPDNQLVGYVRLKNGMTVIKGSNIFNAQEVLHKSGSGARNILRYEFTSPIAGSSATVNLYLASPNEYIDKVTVVIDDDNPSAAGSIRIYEHGISPDIVATTEIDVKKAGLYQAEMAYSTTRTGGQFIKAVLTTNAASDQFSGAIALHHGQTSEL